MKGSTRLEQKNGHLPHVEVDEVLGLVRNVGAKIAPDNTVPRGVKFFVELFLDKGSNILFDVEFLECLVSTVNSILLHLLVHVSVLYYCLPICHSNYNNCV